MINNMGGKTAEVKMQLGNLHQLIQGHGSLVDAVQATLTMGSAMQDNLSNLRGDIDSFSRDLQEFAKSAEVSSETVIGYHLQDPREGEFTTPGNEDSNEIVGDSLGGVSPTPFTTANTEDPFHVLVARRRVRH